jgi:hypothetical protein
VEVALAQVLWAKQSVATPLLVSEFRIGVRKATKLVLHLPKMKQFRFQKFGIAHDVGIQPD